ncbi:MAG: hypothetical protein RI972_1268, partial [Pseudomonadota bacterium]
SVHRLPKTLVTKRTQLVSSSQGFQRFALPNALVSIHELKNGRTQYKKTTVDLASISLWLLMEGTYTAVWLDIERTESARGVD